MKRTVGLPKKARTRRALLLGAAALGVALSAAAQQGIFTCIDAKGRRHTSDRFIPQCLDREQRVLNRDGSTRQVIGPSLSLQEQAQAEAREQQLQAERAKQAEAARRDRLLVARYPSQAEHQRAREEALDEVRSLIRKSEVRIAQLEEERKPLQQETEFYRNKPLPEKLQQALEANEVAVKAQKNLIANQQAELERINSLFDRELERLRTLWGDRGESQDRPPASGQTTTRK